MSLKITCSDCEAEVTHECQRWRDRDEEGHTIWRERDERYHANPLVHAFIELLLWKPEGGLPEPFVEAMKQSDWYSEGDEDMPFFSQSVIYPLLDWKDNARSLFYRLHEWMRAAGFEPRAIERLAHKIRTQQEGRVASMSGGLLPSDQMSLVDWVPETGWTVGLSGYGVGVVTAQITDVQNNPRREGPRGDWDVRVYFEGGGDCHLRRLLRVAHWIKNAEGTQVWPPAESETT